MRVKKLFKTSISLLFSGLLNLNDDKSVIESVQTMLLPGIERRVAAKKRLEDLAISTLVENVTLLQSQNLPSDSDFQTASESENLSQEPQPSSSSSYHNAEWSHILLKYTSFVFHITYIEWLFNLKDYTANVLSAENTDVCLRTKSKDN